MGIRVEPGSVRPGITSSLEPKVCPACLPDAAPSGTPQGDTAGYALAKLCIPSTDETCRFRSFRTRLQ